VQHVSIAEIVKYEYMPSVLVRGLLCCPLLLVIDFIPAQSVVQSHDANVE